MNRTKVEGGPERLHFLMKMKVVRDAVLLKVSSNKSLRVI